MSVLSSGSIDTSAVDKYRQGIELTQDKHFVAGIVKIWSGYPYHELPQTAFGELTRVFDDEPFEEKRKFDTTDYISHSSQKSSFERFTRDMLRRDRDGAIEVFDIRSGTLDGTAQPVRGAKGQFGTGITNEFGETAQIVDEINVRYTGSLAPFLDGGAIIKRETYRTGKLPKEEHVIPYADDFPAKKGLALPASASYAFISARTAMTGTDLNSRLSNKSKSMTSGFVYDGANYGTDSLAFGGLKW